MLMMVIKTVIHMDMTMDSTEKIIGMAYLVLFPCLEHTGLVTKMVINTDMLTAKMVTLNRIFKIPKGKVLNKNYLVTLTKMEGLSFINRVFNRIPKNIKAIRDGTGNNDKK